MLTLECGSCSFTTALSPEARAIASLRAHTNSVHVDWRTRQQQQLIQQARQKQHHVITEPHNKAIPQTAIGSSETTTGCTAITRQQQPTHQEAQEEPEQPAVPPTPAQKPAAKDDAARSPAKRATKAKKLAAKKPAPKKLSRCSRDQSVRRRHQQAMRILHRSPRSRDTPRKPHILSRWPRPRLAHTQRPRLHMIPYDPGEQRPAGRRLQPQRPQACTKLAIRKALTTMRPTPVKGSFSPHWVGRYRNICNIYTYKI